VNQQYEGVYELHERVKIDKHRLDLPKIDANDLAGDSLTGGYILKVDKRTGTVGQGWDSPINPNVFFQFHEPEEAELLPGQIAYVQNFMAGFENAHNSPNFANPVNGYRRYIDVESFMDFMIMQEVGRTVDGYRSSCFLHKQRDSYGGKLSAGPMWDFNLSYGNADYCDAFLTTGYQYDFNNVCSGFYPEVPFWWGKFMQDPRWQRELRCRWDFLRAGPLAIPTVHAWIDSVATVLDEAKTRNFDRWPILGTYVNWNYFVGNTYAEEITYLKTWIADRITWLDANFPGAPPACSSPGASDIQLTEVNYNAAATAPANDWYELHNAGAAAVDLSGWRMKDSNPDNLYTFPAGISIAAGGYLVVCTDTTAFHGQHPTVTPISGPFHFDLGNGGDAIRIFDSYYTEQLTMRFDDTLPWVTSPDGGGYTLELLSANGDLSDPANWFAGCLGGSPGGPYVTPCAVAVSDPLAESSLQAFPNPFQQQLTVALTRPRNTSMHITLYDMTGRVVMGADAPAHERYVLHTSALPVSTYLLRVTCGDWADVRKVSLMR
jgi:CotH kinase protein/Lamin Tail Domain/Secretion system C-terminal sorting domain